MTGYPAESPVDILGMDRAALARDLNESLELQPFRARQLMGWLYRRRHTAFDDMTDISKPVREALARRYRIYRPGLDTISRSADGTKKFLFSLDDGSAVETVLIRQDRRNTLCLSSQVGCKLGCRFCRTARMGFKRNLQAYEIVSQVLAVQDTLDDDADEMFSNIVLMGMGEPLDNAEHVAAAVRVLNDELGFDFSGRKITVSTAGLVPGITAFADAGAKANLAVSLNATTDEVRNQIMPINRKYPLNVLLESLRAYPLTRRQRITVEYVLLRGINDTDRDLERIPNLLRGIPVKINLIPFNPHSGLDYHPPLRETLERWQDVLENKGYSTTIRWSRGQDINAACGQLASASGQGGSSRGPSKPNG